MGCIPPSNITNLVNDEMEDMVINAKKKNYINEIFNIRNNQADNSLQKKTNVLRYKMSCLKYTYALFKKVIRKSEFDGSKRP